MQLSFFDEKIVKLMCRLTRILPLLKRLVRCNPKNDTAVQQIQCQLRAILEDCDLLVDEDSNAV